MISSCPEILHAKDRQLNQLRMNMAFSSGSQHITVQSTLKPGSFPHMQLLWQLNQTKESTQNDKTEQIQVLFVWENRQIFYYFFNFFSAGDETHGHSC